MNALLEKINTELEIFKTESGLQAEKGNKAAGTRVRKSALKLSKLFKEFRKFQWKRQKNNAVQSFSG
ncbi:histone H1 [Flavobacterium alkalisoli]|uniref:Histone H1 n=1 Tax=Flavobacterium alkalisoli TaxID=2602769 RepID=A0A5B9FVU0_9FLAO|nr:histone H1 [Flavobacterium alkalisoli]QEE49868.1 histone H1 [Flavobacterium alkalisoli]